MTNFLAAHIVNRFGPRICLVLGSCTYVGFVAANIEFNEYGLYTASALIGIGASVLWTSQGV